jgi:hypothetical protein
MLEASRAFGGRRFSPPYVAVRGGRLDSFPPFVAPNWPLEEHSALVTLLHQTALRIRLGDRERDQEQATRLLLGEMKAAADRAGARFLVATVWDGGPPGPGFYDRMRAAMREDRIEETNITYRGAETRPETLLVGGNGHPGPIIHAWWAEKLAAWMETQ